MKKKALNTLNHILDILEFILAGMIVLVLVAMIGIELYRLALDPSALLEKDFLDGFLSSVTTLVVAVEFVKMLLHPTAGNILELLIMAISRYIVLSHHDHVAIAVGVASITALFAVRHFLVPKSRQAEAKEEAALQKTEL